ncbi:MAG: TVP38/TMEM64 family protein [Candidatus Levybacteria bacterium]|nr:TVP38/TMEM64 family protein [Candidatus Levybacteria bacterium]
MRKKYIAISILALIALSLLLAFFIFINPYKLAETTFTKEHLYIAAFSLVLIRIIGIVFPFIPGGIVSFALVPLLGWFNTYVYTVTGIFIGTSLAFWLARKYREPLVAKFIPLQKIRQLEKQMSTKKQFLAIVALRLFTVPVIDFSSYIAGFTKISYKKFAAATLIASLPDILIFYLGEEAYKRFFGDSLFVGAIILLIMALIYFIIKRYNYKKKSASLKALDFTT